MKRRRSRARTATTFVVGALGTFTVTTGPHFPAAETISETGALPSGVGFVDNGDGTATLSGTPGAGTGGSYPINITASNGVAPNATQSFTLTVNQAPAITSANATTFTVGTLGTFTVTTTGSSPMTLSEGGALPSGVTFVDNGDGTATLSGTPAAGTDGTYNLLFTASNGVAPDATQNFTLTVNPAAAPTPTPCAPPPSGLVSWWPGDGNARDIWGSHNGTLENGATTAAGKVGQAFSLDGGNDYVDVPASVAILQARLRSMPGLSRRAWRQGHEHPVRSLIVAVRLVTRSVVVRMGLLFLLSRE